MAGSLSPALGAWENSSKAAVAVPGAIVPGCGLTGTVDRYFGPTNQRTPPGCRIWASRASNLYRHSHPSVAVLTTGMWDLLDAKIPGGGSGWHTYGDAIYERFVLRELQAVTDAFSAHGVLVVWLTTPDINQTPRSVVGPLAPGSQMYVYSGVDNARVSRLNTLIRLVVASRPRSARLVDLHGWMVGRYDNANLRPDGMHFDWAAATNLSRTFLGPQILAQYQSWRQSLRK